VLNTVTVILKNVKHNCTLPRFQASAAMLKRSVLFWDITLRRVVMDVSGKRIRPVIKDEVEFLMLEDGTDTLSRNVRQGLSRDAAQYSRRAQISSLL
jgi:hypothetical protein